ncbi:innexin inx2 [Hydra vulgaris]|uniref:Innexin n=1 Tax=Hydra vulgaris TaxID=6087 RepID=A0A5B8HTC1_HYDVU|nr:innexin 4 [Hydra vulgaris]
MSIITGNLKSLLTIKFKPRHDTFTDQFNRIFMVKMAMVASFLLGLNWFKDTITCIVPASAGIDKGYVAQGCWIQGFYIYKELKRVPGLLGYYGVPKDIYQDGMFEDGTLCKSSEKNCIPMTKTFYLQYQWFPFYIASLGLLYYFPYIVFRFVNTDLISLRTSIKAINVNIDDLVKNYFNYQINPPNRMRMRLFGNLGVKLSYLIVNVVAFTVTDGLINNDFGSYGFKWLGWSKGTNQESYDYTASRGSYKAGEVLLPNFGFCDLLEISQDIKQTTFNNHRFVCEISQNILYQYVLVILWFLYIIGMIISSIGFLWKLVNHFILVGFLYQGSEAKKVYEMLTFREREYLEFVRKKNMTIYGELIRKLKDDRLRDVATLKLLEDSTGF